MLKELNTYDWEEAFKYANPPELIPCDNKTPNNNFDIEDVTEILAAIEGEGDGDSWVIIVKLKDNRYAVLEAWCDYTGWGCQAGGNSIVCNNLNLLWKFGITDRGRFFQLSDSDVDIRIKAAAYSWYNLNFVINKRFFSNKNICYYICG